MNFWADSFNSIFQFIENPKQLYINGLNDCRVKFYGNISNQWIVYYMRNMNITNLLAHTTTEFLYFCPGTELNETIQ